MIWFLLIPLILWMVIMTVLFTPKGTYSSFLDRLTRARYRNDRIVLQIMLDHLRSFPEQWSISSDAASFPLEGAKKIYLNFDKGWEYTLDGFGRTPRKLDGYFGKEFGQQLSLVNSSRENEAVLRSFYPNLDGPLLLGKYS